MTAQPVHRFILALLLLALAASAACSKPPAPHISAPMFATINADCAPWDGSAFTLSIGTSHGGSISVSIWQAPDMADRAVFSFPDSTGQVGNAVYWTLDGASQPMRGTVAFDRVQVGPSVQGSFDLTADTGEHFTGQFEAFWGQQRALCG